MKSLVQTGLLIPQDWLHGTRQNPCNFQPTGRLASVLLLCVTPSRSSKSPVPHMNPYLVLQERAEDPACVCGGGGRRRGWAMRIRDG